MQRSNIIFLNYLTIAGLALGLCFFGSVVYADSHTVQSEQLNLSAARPVASLQLNNSSAQDKTLKFEIVQWQQEGDREWITPSRNLIVVPAKITLKPGQSEKVSVSMRLTGSFWDEEAYRVLVTETAHISKGSQATDYSEGRTSHPSSVPVFLQPPGSASPRVSWSLKSNDRGGVVLRARNNGKGHVQLNSASLLGPSGQSLQKPSMTDILLPGGARSWEFEENVMPGQWHLIADTNAGPMRVTLELAPDATNATALSFSQ